MVNSSYTWRQPREFDDEKSTDGVELRSLTPATLGKPRSSLASCGNKTSSFGKDGVAVSGERNVKSEMPEPRPIPSQPCESLSAAERNRYDHASGSGARPRRERTGEAVQVVIPRLRRAGDVRIVNNNPPAASNRTFRREWSPEYQPAVSSMESRGNEDVIWPHGQVERPSCSRERPPTPGRRGNIRDVRGLSTIQEGDHEQVEEDKQKVITGADQTQNGHSSSRPLLWSAEWRGVWYDHSRLHFSFSRPLYLHVLPRRA